MGVATQTKRWTLDDLHRLPDDGNKYELVRGELFVTPAPKYVHQAVIARLARMLEPYVAANGLGYVWQARSVVRRKGNEVEPDLFVARPLADPAQDWDAVEAPALVVEVLSDSTRRRDLNEKRVHYLEDVAVPDYWVVDPERRTVHVMRAGHADTVVTGPLTWSPVPAAEALVFDVRRLFEG